MEATTRGRWKSVGRITLKVLAVTGLVAAKALQVFFAALGAASGRADSMPPPTLRGPREEYRP